MRSIHAIKVESMSHRLLVCINNRFCLTRLNVTESLFLHVKKQSLMDRDLFDGCAFYRAESAGDTMDEVHADIIRKGQVNVKNEVLNFVLKLFTGFLVFMFSMYF